MTKYTLNIFFISLFFFVIVGCQKKTEQLPKVINTEITPRQEINASTLSCYDNGNLIWKLDTDYSKRNLDDTSSMLVVPVRLSIFDTSSDYITEVFSDSGTTTYKLERFFIWGNVYIKKWDGLRIKAKSLWWDKNSRKIGSDDFVEIRTPQGDILRGIGLDGSDSFSWWTLRHNVSGSFPNFNNRSD